MPDRQSEQGSWVARNRQSLTSGRWSAGNSKKRLMAYISPCQSGFSVSLLVSATTTDRSDLRRMAAPNSLLPWATPARVIGAMSCSMTSSKRETRSAVFMVMFVRQLGDGAQGAVHRNGILQDYCRRRRDRPPESRWLLRAA